MRAQTFIAFANLRRGLRRRVVGDLLCTLLYRAADGNHSRWFNTSGCMADQLCVVGCCELLPRRGDQNSHMSWMGVDKGECLRTAVSGNRLVIGITPTCLANVR